MKEANVKVEEERAEWDNKVQYLLGVISYAVGLGNVWRFPYLCQQNGGGAFLIPYIIMLFLEGLPLSLLEMGIGQRMRKGTVGTWIAVHPVIGGLGMASAAISFMVGLYYNVIIAWCFYYLFNSFQSPLPWAQCPEINGSLVPECAKSSPTEYFWYRETLNTTESISDIGTVRWWMMLCLLLAWTLVYCCIMRGIQTSGKAMYVTAVFPYVVLTVFFGRAISLEGAAEGLMHMITPKVERLLDPAVWMDAAIQVFYSVGVAFGSLIAFSSYNPSNNNCLRDSIFTTFVNLITSILTCVVVFSVLGFKATTSFHGCLDENKHLTMLMNSTENLTLTMKECNLQNELDKAAEGTGLAFIVFAEAIVELPGAPFWSVVFFLMLISLGVGSQLGIMESVITNVFDTFTTIKIRKEILSGVVCICCFLLGLIFTTGAGEYWVSLVDSFAATTGFMMVAFCELIAVMYVYGHKRFSDDIQKMTGTRPGIFWQATWRFISPISIAFILIATFVKRVMNRPQYLVWDQELAEPVKQDLPVWALCIGAACVLLSILPIFLVMMVKGIQLLMKKTKYVVEEGAGEAMKAMLSESPHGCENSI